VTELIVPIKENKGDPFHPKEDSKKREVAVETEKKVGIKKADVEL